MRENIPRNWEIDLPVLQNEDNVMISAVINTLNEEERLIPCLESLKGVADEIIVVDMHSDDKTRDIAESYGAKIILHQRVRDCPDVAKRPGIQATTNEWVLMLDADERVPVELGEKLKAIAAEGSVDGVIVARKNVTFGKWLRYGGWWRVNQVKMFRKDKIVWGWEEEAHRQVEINGNLLKLPREESMSLVHENFQNPWEVAERVLFRYARFEAERMSEKGVPFSVVNMFWQPVRSFMVSCFLRCGFRDGIAGLIMNTFMACYQFMIWANLWSLTARKHK